MSEEEKKENPQEEDLDIKAEEPEEKKAEEEKEKVEEEKKPEDPEKKKLEEEIHSLKVRLENIEVDLHNAKKEAEDWKNKYYLAYADMANTRKEVQRETADFKKYARQSVIEEFIPVLDSFDMALKNEPTDPTIKKYLEGFQMIHGKLLSSLTQMDVQIIDPKKGDVFDPNQMNAFSSVDGEEDNLVADTFLKGYKMHDHLLRPAGVIITHKVEKKEEKAEESASENTEEKEEEQKNN